MTIDEAIQRKIYKLRLPFFIKTAFVDPRVTEKKGGLMVAPIIDPANVDRDLSGKRVSVYVLVTPDLQWECPIK